MAQRCRVMLRVALASVLVACACAQTTYQTFQFYSDYTDCTGPATFYGVQLWSTVLQMSPVLTGATLPPTTPCAAGGCAIGLGLVAGLPVYSTTDCSQSQYNWLPAGQFVEFASYTAANCSADALSTTTPIAYFPQNECFTIVGVPATFSCSGTQVTMTTYTDASCKTQVASSQVGCEAVLNMGSNSFRCVSAKSSADGHVQASLLLTVLASLLAASFTL